MSDTLKDQDDAAQAAGTGAPRVTLKYMEDRMERVDYFTLGDVILGDRFERTLGLHGEEVQARPVHNLDCTTVCAISMSNGFVVQGYSACASPENFNETFGRELAYKDAVNKLWSLEAYLLRERLAAHAASEVVSHEVLGKAPDTPRHQFDDPPKDD